MRKRVSIVVVLLAVFGVLSYGVASAQGSYGPDLSTTGGAIDCGNNGSGVTKAADDSNATTWFSSQTGASVAGAGCIGQDFGSGNAYHIRQFTIKQSDATHCVSSVFVQNSSNGSSWTTSETVAVTCDGIFHAYALASSGAYRYWRILANSVVTGSNVWGVIELELMEAYSFPTSTPGPTDTPTNTLTPTVTLTPSITPSPTNDYEIRITATTGAVMKLDRTATFGDTLSFAGSMVVAVILLAPFAVKFWRERIVRSDN